MMPQIMCVSGDEQAYTSSSKRKLTHSEAWQKQKTVCAVIKNKVHPPIWMEKYQGSLHLIHGAHFARRSVRLSRQCDESYQTTTAKGLI